MKGRELNPRALTVLALAILITTPALLRFAAGNLGAFSLSLWLLAGVVIAYGGLYVLGRIWSRYARPRGQQ